MKIEKAIISVTLGLIAAGTAFGQRGLPRNSYLDTQVKSTAQLIHQVETDAAVMDRYCRHFAMTRQEVITYLSGLRMSTLAGAGIYTVYGVPHSSGDFHAHLKRLEKGEPVFVEADGTPVLMVVCGNPLILGPKKPVTPNAVIVSTGSPDGVQDVPVDSSSIPSSVIPTAETPGDATPIQPEYPEAHRDIPNVLPILLGLAGSVGFSAEHHSPPVPEPFSIAALGVGIAALAVRRKIKMG